MKNIPKSILLLAIAFASQSSQASQELAKPKSCTACHAPSTKLVAPSFKEIANKYGGDAGAEAKLFVKVQKGSTGVWGPVPMPANPQVNEADARTLLKWILEQK